MVSSADYVITRGGLLIEPDPNDPREAEGILNPAVAGSYLLYRAVGRGNFSRLMAAKLSKRSNGQGVKVLAKKMNRVVLEPQVAYELTKKKRGGIEDPRVTQLPDGMFVMFYTGYGRAIGFQRQTPVVAVATSENGLTWQRQGRMVFAKHTHGGQLIDFNQIANKDTVLFAEKINSRYALLHRPMFGRLLANQLGLPWRAIWYAEADSLLGPWDNHRLLLGPKYEWENGGVGAGVPPIHLRDAWVHIYHGFTQGRHRRYNVGVFVTPHDDPTIVAYRSERALLEPSELEEMEGTVPRVVFPTAVWQEDEKQNDLAIFWGAADTRIMWGILSLPSEVLDPLADSQHNS